MPEEKGEKIGLFLVAIVAIIAIVAILTLLSGRQASDAYVPVMGQAAPADLAGQAYYYYSTPYSQPAYAPAPYVPPTYNTQPSYSVPVTPSGDNVGATPIEIP